MNEIRLIISVACLATATVTLARTLPAQNIAFIVVALVVVELVAEYWTGSGELAAGAIFWPAAIIWLRAGAQVLLRPWRRNRNYGLYLIGVTCMGATALQIMFSPSLFGNSASGISGRTTLAAGRFCLTAVCMVFLMPWFLQKRVIVSGESKR